jgi:predicted nicotinamide N-methyase
MLRKQVEVGSGTGVVGLFAAALGSRCVLTDYRPPLETAAVASYGPDGGMDDVEVGNEALCGWLSFLNVESIGI